MPKAADDAADRIDRLLKNYARSPLLDPDPEKQQRMADRTKNLKDAKALFPGQWRGRDYKKGSQED